MAKVRHYNIVLAVITQGEKYLLQRRGKNPNVNAAGLIGFFGGKIEDDENPIQALCREVAEETNLQPSPEDLNRIGCVNIEMELADGRGEVDAEVFTLEIAPGANVEAREWDLATLPIKDARKHINELTPATKAVFEEILWR